MKCVNAFWAGDDIVALFRHDSGERETKKFPARYVHYLRRSDVDAKFERDLRGSKHIIGLQPEGQWLRVTWRNWFMMTKACLPGGFFDTRGIATYEADLKPVKRWLIERNVPIARPRRCYVDIETDSRKTIEEAKAGKARILCWSIHSDDSDIAISGVLEDDTDEAEKELWKDLIFELREYEQIVSWNGEDFDFEVMQKRCKELGVPFDRRVWLFLDHMLVFQRLNMSASESGDEKQSMSLDAIATALVGVGKSPFDASRTYEAWAAGGESRRELVRYNVRDTWLMKRIEQVSGYLEIQQVICELSGVLPNSQGANPTNFVEAYALRLARKRDIHFRSHYVYEERRLPGYIKPEQYAGAYVMQPTRVGIVENVHVCDFAALYPSIMISWNMSPDTKVGKLDPNDFYEPVHAPDGISTDLEATVADGLSVAPLTGVTFRQDEVGIIPAMLIELMGERKRWKDLKESLPPGTQDWKDADRRSTSYKTMTNSVYGVTGSELSRLFDREVAESTTTTGEWLIKLVLSNGDARGYCGFYGDTDSGFVTDVTREAFGSFVEWCNKEVFPEKLREHGCKVNRVKLAYEKAFKVMIMMPKKKRYAASFLHAGGTDAGDDAKFEIKGFEYKRGDTARLARQMQEQLIERILRGGARTVDDLEGFVVDWQRFILEGDLAIEDITLTKKLSGAPSTYKRKELKNGNGALSAWPLHVQIADTLNREEGRGLGEGHRITYVVTDASGKNLVGVPLERFEGVFDRYYVWDTLVYPASQRILEAAIPSARWKQLLKVRPKAPRKKSIAI